MYRIKKTWKGDYRGYLHNSEGKWVPRVRANEYEFVLHWLKCLIADANCQ